jgi:hypothetical protein
MSDMSFLSEIPDLLFATNGNGELFADERLSFGKKFFNKEG